jgi:hypothetical protein
MIGFVPQREPNLNLRPPIPGTGEGLPQSLLVVAGPSMSFRKSSASSRFSGFN